MNARPPKHARLLHGILSAALAAIAAPVAASPMPVDVDGLFAVADVRMRARVAEMSAYPQLRWPLSRGAASATWHAPADVIWDSGYFPGTLWQLYERDRDPQWLAHAKRWTNGLIGLAPDAPVPADLGGVTLAPEGHDVGLVYLTSFARGHAITGDAGYARVMRRAADQLAARRHAPSGTLRSWDWGPWSSPVIVDGLMTVQTLNWAAGRGGTSAHAPAALTSMAAGHARATATHHQRADGSTFHVVDFGRSPPVGSTFQGYSDASTWARGQAWAIHGFTASHAANPVDGVLLDAARRAADYFLSRTTDDAVPLYDLDLPTNAPASVRQRDSSAAAIAASGLIDLSVTTDRPAERRRYYQAAERILRRLATPAYLAAAAPGESRLLLHGVGAMPFNAAVDASLSYADYYFLEALTRYEAHFPGPGIAPGDATRDGRVDFADLVTLAQHYGQPSGRSWLDGDFTREGVVGFDDLVILAQHYGTLGTNDSADISTDLSAGFADDWALARALVPEPAMLAALVAAFPITTRRRRRHP